MSGTQTPVLPLFTTAELVQTVRNLKTSQQFLLSRFFPNVIEFDTEEVAIDVDTGKRRLAPFCSPLVQGKVVEGRTWQTNLFKPAYIKDKRAPDLLRPVRRAIGERLLGAMSPQQRLDANLGFEMTDQIDMIDRRLEWMAAQALLSGTITIVGDGYPNPIVINFQRDAALTIALTGGAKWGTNGVSPTANLMAWASIVLQKSGAAPIDVVLTPSPLAALTADLRLINSVLMPRSGDSQFDFGGRVQRGAVSIGSWGQFNFWLYNDWFVDPVTDTEGPMIPDGTIIMSSPQMEGTRGFGAIMDPKFNYGAMAYAPKMWDQEDPAQRFLMMQSAPIVIPSRVNASLAATVMDAGGPIYQPPI
jgi:hypothetical protein